MLSKKKDDQCWHSPFNQCKQHNWLPVIWKRHQKNLGGFWLPHIECCIHLKWIRWHIYIGLKKVCIRDHLLKQFSLIFFSFFYTYIFYILDFHVTIWQFLIIWVLQRCKLVPLKHHMQLKERRKGKDECIAKHVGNSRANNRYSVYITPALA